MSKIGDTLKQFAPALEADALAFFENEKPTVVDALKKAEASAVVELGSLVTQGLHSGSPFEKLAANAIAHAFESQEANIIAALGGEDEALYQLAVHLAVTELHVVIEDAEHL